MNNDEVGFHAGRPVILIRRRALHPRPNQSDSGADGVVQRLCITQLAISGFADTLIWSFLSVPDVNVALAIAHSRAQPEPVVHLTSLACWLFSETYANSRIGGTAGRPVAEHLFIIFIKQVVGPYENVGTLIDVIACCEVQQPVTFE